MTSITNVADNEQLSSAYMSDSREGEVLSKKYRLVRKLGQGGMGTIYEAVHTDLSRRVAIKFLNPELTQDEDARVRFEREAKAAGGLQHENIVATNDCGIASDGKPYIVMEYLEGEGLRDLLTREEQLPIIRALNIAIQVCQGLRAAHKKGIVHRDLKPENLFITRRGDGSDLVKILDFGIAKLRGDPNSPQFTRPGTVMGTLHYMSNEQLRGDPELDERADVYSLAAIVYECLTGKVPHPGDSYADVFHHLLFVQVEPLSSLRPGLPEGLEPVVLKSLAIEPLERHQDVVEFMEALNPFAARQITPLASKIIGPSGNDIAETIVNRSEVGPKSISSGEDASQALGQQPEEHLVSKVTRARFGIKAVLVFIGLLAAIGIVFVGWFFPVFRSNDLPASADSAKIVKPVSQTPTDLRAAKPDDKSTNPSTAVPAAPLRHLVDGIGDHPRRFVEDESKTDPSKYRQIGTRSANREEKRIQPIGRPTGQQTEQSGQQTGLVRQPSIALSTESTPQVETKPKTIERSHGNRKISFDTKSPYE